MTYEEEQWNARQALIKKAIDALTKGDMETARTILRGFSGGSKYVVVAIREDSVAAAFHASPRSTKGYIEREFDAGASFAMGLSLLDEEPSGG